MKTGSSIEKLIHTDYVRVYGRVYGRMNKNFEKIIRYKAKIHKLISFLK